MKTVMYLMSNDAKWMEQEQNLDFTPCPGMNFEGLAEDQPLRVNLVAYNFETKNYIVKLAWLSDSPISSKELISLGWKVKEDKKGP